MNILTRVLTGIMMVVPIALFIEGYISAGGICVISVLSLILLELLAISDKLK